MHVDKIDATVTKQRACLIRGRFNKGKEDGRKKNCDCDMEKILFVCKVRRIYHRPQAIFPCVASRESVVDAQLFCWCVCVCVQSALFM